jgi:RNA polymerase sigma factor (sigma-70 family)
MPTSKDAADELLAHRARFKAFLAARLGSETDAEDILQESLQKAWQRTGEIRDHEKLVPWFYQLLRHAVVDHGRSRRSAAAREQAWAGDPSLQPSPAEERELCRCFEPLLATLKPAQAELLRRVELGNQAVADAARELGLTANHASVALHRARATLRAKLEETCGPCANTGCLDCDCPPGPDTKPGPAR